MLSGLGNQQALQVRILRAQGGRDSSEKRRIKPIMVQGRCDVGSRELGKFWNLKMSADGVDSCMAYQEISGVVFGDRRAN